MFVSFAQNFEDVMLYRALREVENGFYVDVGANHPVNDSVTKAFYDRGWRGINVEPGETMFQKLVTERPEDLNLQIAISAAPGPIRFFELPDSGLSTTSREIATSYAARGQQLKETWIEARTLTEILEEYGDGEIHFLKIDVEGAECDVIMSMDFDRVRPWIVLVEATQPGTPIADHAEWEPLLTGAAYEFAYFDGLNRFYVAAERRELLIRFDAPPNIFDNFVKNSERLSFEHNRDLVNTIEAKEKYLCALEGCLKETTARAEQAESERELMRVSAEKLRLECELREDRIREAESHCESLSREIEILTEVNAAMNHRVESMAGTLANLQSRLDSTAKELLYRQDLLDEAARALTAERMRSRDLLEERESVAESTRLLRRQIEQRENELGDLRHELSVMIGSRSWRWTRPLRLANAALNSILDSVVALAVRTIRPRPALKSIAAKCLRQFPSIDLRLRKRIHDRRLMPPLLAPTESTDPSVQTAMLPLTSRGRRILSELNAARDRSVGRSPE